MNNTLNQEYRDFLETYFKGLRVRVPLFYNWNYGLRFGLSDTQLQLSKISDGAEANEYFKEVVSRASTIFETAFDKTNELFFVFMSYAHKKQKIRFTNYAFKQLRDLQKNEIFYIQEKNLYSHINDYKDKYNVALIKTTTGRINHHNLLTAVANTDFLRQPRITQDKDIYFININKQLIFHMYDDRGLDIIAANIETLRPIYEKHNNWLLDYDREKIDKQFQ